MMTSYAKVYISMPQNFLSEVDRTAREEHLSRSGLIREAIKLYMATRRGENRPRFFEMTKSLRARAGDRSDEELGLRIDQALNRVRSRDGL